MMKSLKTLLRLQRNRGSARKRAPSASAENGSAHGFAWNWAKIGLVTFAVAALSLLMSVHLLPDKISLQLGDISPVDVRAARSVIYVNSANTQTMQRAARAATRALYDVDERAAVDANRLVQAFFDSVERARATSVHRPNSKLTVAPQAIVALRSQVGPGYTEGQLRHLLALSPADFQKVHARTAALVSYAMGRELRDLSDDLKLSGDVPGALKELTAAAHGTLTSEDTGVAQAVARQALRPNRRLNRAKTETAQEASARSVAPDVRQIARGDRVIGVGEKVTQEHLDKFTALGLLNPRLEITTGAAICVLAAAMVLLVAFAMKRTLPALYADTRRLALLTVIVLVSVLGLKVSATMLGLQFSSGQLGYLGMMSVAAAGMLVSVLLDMHLAVLIVALLAVQSGLIMNHEIRFTVMTLMSSLVGIFSVGGVRSRNNLLVTTVALAGANLSLVWLLGLLLRDSPSELLTGSVWAVGSAFFATFLYWFGVLALEKPFGILTHTTLLEMSAFDRPLLRRLCAAAPGTYAHSMMVGTLAEAGAQSVGADALLCRVGGYYHDIGKMNRPEFFVENQRRENVHGRLSPSLSALIITAHVRDGIEMAKEHRLPTEIRDIIAQHHGTTLIRYFYYQALADCESGGEAPPGLEERFRYPGPKPRTRESAIVMLADSVEAASRCLEKPTLERLEAMIGNILRDKIEDGQLDDCPLTFRDVKSISDAFLHVLKAMMHGRIDYPNPLPRTATGHPMVVSRPDLQPERRPLARPLAGSDLPSEVLPLIANDVPAEGSAEAAHEIPASFRAGDGLSASEVRSPLEALHETLHYDERIAIDGPGVLPTMSLPPHVGPYVEPEVLYGRSAAECASAPDTNDEAASGGPPPAAGGRPGPGGS